MTIRTRMTLQGIAMLIPFFLLLLGIFSPVFPGRVNGLDYMDNLFNTISKGSSCFIPDYLQRITIYAGKQISATISLTSHNQAVAVAKLITMSEGKATVGGNQVSITGEMDKILRNCLMDADLMFNNDSLKIQEKYGYDGHTVLYNWWFACKSIVTELTRQKRFEDAKVFNTIKQKAVEPAYNYFGVESSGYRENFILITLALVFYVTYTLWYGFGIMYLFEGMGLKVGH